MDLNAESKPYQFSTVCDDIAFLMIEQYEKLGKNKPHEVKLARCDDSRNRQVDENSIKSSIRQWRDLLNRSSVSPAVLLISLCFCSKSWI